MLKALIIIIVFIAAGVGGLQYYISYKVDKGLEKMGNFMRLVGGDLSYQKVRTTYDGAIEVVDVKFDFPIEQRGKDIINSNIDMIRIKFPSLLDIIQQGADDFSELPESLQFEAKGTRFSSAQIDQLNRELQPGLKNNQPFYMDATDMGVDEIVADYTMGYVYDSFTEGLDIDFGASEKGLGSYSYNIKIKNIKKLHPTAFMMQEPQLQLMTINYDDKNYTSMWLNHCKEKNKITADQCISNEIEKFNLKLSKDYQLKFSDKFVTQISGYMKNSGNFKISIDLSEGPQSLKKIMEIGDNPLELFIYQNVILSINGEYIQPIFNPLSEDEAAQVTKALEKPKESKKKTARPQKQKIVLKTYQDFKPYIGKKVLIITDKRKQYIGVVLDAQSDKVKVKVRLAKGDTFTYRLAYDRIKYAEVYQEKELY